MFIITGASGGIGYEIFQKLSIKNEVLAISNKKKLHSRDKGICENVNLLDHEEINKLVIKYKNILEHITIIQLAVNSFDGLLANYPIEKVRETFELNLYSNIYLVQALLPIMINQKWGGLFISLPS